LQFKDLKKYLSKLDWFLIITVFISTIFGWLLVKSTTNPMPTKNTFVIVQSGAIFIGIVSMLFMANLDYCHVVKYTKYFYALAIAGMVIVLIFGEGADEVGRGSWIRFFGIGIQPSELVKILYIVCLAKELDKIKENINHPLDIALTMLYAGIILGMVVFDNLGSALVFIFITLIMFFIAVISLWYFLAFGVTITALSPIIWNFFV
jgi:rod shape determining protein RodA